MTDFKAQCFGMHLIGWEQDPDLAGQTARARTFWVRPIAGLHAWLSVRKSSPARLTGPPLMPYSHPQGFDRQEAIRQVRHLLPGAVLLAATAGFVNTVSLGFFHTPVSHMTGAVSHLGMDLVVGRSVHVLTSLSIVLGFLIGAILAGLLVGALKLIPGRRYGVALMIEGGLLSLATWLLLHQNRLALPLVAMACGLQNAMTSSYCGLMIRTTHVTGMVTDIGVMLGHWLRHRQIAWWKLRFLVMVFGAFGLGGWLGAIADSRFGVGALGLPAGGCLIAGGLFWLLTHRGVVSVMQNPEPKPPRTSTFPQANG
jgi:uncharacterized membrane protein YoaK (UPF0700 family)